MPDFSKNTVKPTRVKWILEQLIQDLTDDVKFISSNGAGTIFIICLIWKQKKEKRYDIKADGRWKKDVLVT